MFVELFETISNHLGEFLLGLGLSAGSIYLIFNIIKGVVYLIFQKKKRQAQTKANNEVVITATAEKVVELLKPQLDAQADTSNKILAKLDSIENSLANQNNEQLETMAIEVKAYQTVMLNQDNELKLQYEQIKSSLINLAKSAKPAIEDVAKTTSEIATTLTEAIESNEENLIKAGEDVATTIKTVKKTAKKVKNKVQQVSYE